MIQPLGQVSKDAEGFKVSFERVYPHNILVGWNELIGVLLKNFVEA